MATITLEQGYQGRRAHEYSKSAGDRQSLLAKAGGMIVGLLAPSAGRHTPNYLASSGERKSRGNLTRRILGKIAGKSAEEPNRNTLEPGRIQKAFKRPEGWRAILPAEYLGVDPSVDLSTGVNHAINTADSYIALETVEWRLRRLAGNATSAPDKVQEDLNTWAGNAQANMASQDPYTSVDTSRYWRQVARSQRSAQSDTHPTRQMKLSPRDN